MPLRVPVLRDLAGEKSSQARGIGQGVFHCRSWRQLRGRRSWREGNGALEDRSRRSSIWGWRDRRHQRREEGWDIGALSGPRPRSQGKSITAVWEQFARTWCWSRSAWRDARASEGREGPGKRWRQCDQVEGWDHSGRLWDRHGWVRRQRSWAS